MIALTANLWRSVQKVNLEVNHRIKYAKDLDHYGKADYWTDAPDGLGDCEDYAIVKQQELAKQGIKSFIATCWCFPNKQGYHAVLLIDTDRGTLVLDNRDDAVWTYEKVGYEWHKREMEGGTWRGILS